MSIGVVNYMWFGLQSTDKIKCCEVLELNFQPILIIIAPPKLSASNSLRVLKSRTAIRIFI